jgi:hypothetical protein
VFLLLSLNIDFFSRDNFVIYLSALVMSLRVPSGQVESRVAERSGPALGGN